MVFIVGTGYCFGIVLVLLRSIDCAHGALRSSGLERSTYRPRRPYTAPPPPLLLVLVVVVVLLLLSQC